MNVGTQGTDQDRTLVVGQAVHHIKDLGSASSVVLIGRQRPDVPQWLSGAEAHSSGDYRQGDLNSVQAMEVADQLMKRWAGATDSRGRQLDELLTYHGIPLWEVVEIDFLHTRLGPIIDELSVWERILEVERPTRLVVPRDGLGRIASVVAMAKGIPFRTIHSGSGMGPGILKDRSLTATVPPRLRAWLRRWKSQLWCWRARWYHRSVGMATADTDGARRIVVLTYTKKCVDIPIAVIRALQADSKNNVLVLDRNFSSAIPRLQDEQIPYRVLEGYGNRKTLGQVRKEEQRLRREWCRLRGDSTFQHQFEHRGFALWPLIEPILQEYLTAFFPEVVRLFEVTRNALRAQRPVVAVITDDRPVFQRVFAWACQKEGVRTVGIQETLIPDLPYGISPTAAEWVAVEGEAVRDILIKRGTPAKRIVVTGQPRFDFLTRLGPRFNRGRVLRDLDLDPTRPTVLLASQYVGVYFRAEDKRRALEKIYAVLAAMPEVQLVVKPHPDEPKSSMERHLAQAAGLRRFRMVYAGEAMELVFASDLVIVFYSTVGHEAILMDRPLIQIPTAPQERLVAPFTEEGGALEARDLDELPRMIHTALYDPATRDRLRQGRQAYIRRHAYALDGRSSERVAELVMRVADGQRP